jgi:hypothetical protein
MIIFDLYTSNKSMEVVSVCNNKLQRYSKKPA